MFQVNDVVIYGHHGVCEITNVGTLKMPMADQEKLYYTLRPVYHKESSVYAPVENRKIVMRSVITKEEAMQTCDCEELVKIIKTLYLRKQQRLGSGKKVTVVDEKYFRQAEDKLYEELAYALGMEKKQVGTYISQHMEEKV
ncbi:MAG: CarD family transcriptional regulator [Lachnospiraceae bacterium]|nr:CarD family transcriptional regulator [Lachnospiraceae bacterium]